MRHPRDEEPDADPSASADPSTTTDGTEPDTGVGNLSDDTIAALQAGLAVEHAALWAYGLVMAYNPDGGDTVTAMISSHQSTRDTAADLIVEAGATPVAPNPAYTFPESVSDAASAQVLGLTIESDCAAAWRSVIGHSDDSTLRGTALSALTDCAMRMVTWRTAAGDTPLTVPFPGDPHAG